MVRNYRNVMIGVLVTAMCLPVNGFAADSGGMLNDDLTASESQDISKELRDSEQSGGMLGTAEESVEESAEENVQNNNGESAEIQPEQPSEHEWKTGWNEYEGNWYYSQGEGKLYFGWIKSKSRWYYLDGENTVTPGVMACDEIKKIKDKYYAFDSNGAMLTEWISRPEGWYYADGSGALCSGWMKVRGRWYYLDSENKEYPLLMKSDEIIQIKDKYYAFDSNGAMLTDWIRRPEGWYYAEGSGALRSDWVKVRGRWYYLNPENEEYPFLMKSDEIIQLEGKYYVLDSNGAMLTDWIRRPEGWYYAEGSGVLCSGWVKVRGRWYYLDSENEEYPFLMKSDEIMQYEGKYYALDKNGAMQVGWISYPEGWYYADRDGGFASGWRKVGTKWYFLDADNPEYPCLMVASETREINGQTYIFESNGAMKAGWEKVDGNWYYYGINSGQKVVGWQFIDGYWYYFYSDEKSYGVMAANTVVDGYVLHGNGAYIRSRNKLGWQNPQNYPQVSSLTVKLPSYCTGYFTYVTPSRISIYATKQDCINAFIARAYEYLGTRYIEPWSSRPGDAVDCSGLVLQCLYATGMDLGVYNPYNHRWLPSQTYNSMNWYNNNTFMPVNVNAIQRGDLIYYRGHVAIYLGNGQIIDSWPGQGVSVKPIGSRGRVIGAARPFV